MKHLVVDFRIQNAITRPHAVPIVTQLNTTQQRSWNHSESLGVTPTALLSLSRQADPRILEQGVAFTTKAIRK